jgi:hypothetical protein
MITANNNLKKESHRVTEWLSLRDPIIQRFRGSAGYHLLGKNGKYAVFSEESLKPHYLLRRYEKFYEEKAHQEIEKEKPKNEDLKREDGTIDLTKGMIEI